MNLMQFSDQGKGGFGLTRRSNGTSSSRRSSGDSNGSTVSNSNHSRNSKGSNSRKPHKSMTPPQPRREFWGHQQSRRRLMGAAPAHPQGQGAQQSQHSGSGDASQQSVDSTESLDLPSSAGTSSRYHLYTAEFEDLLASDALKRVLKLMFSSMAVVFQETQLVKDDFQYTRLPSIPAPAARMLWSELLGGVSVKMGDQGYWKLELSNDHPSDPSLEAAVLEKFVSFINEGDDPIQKKEKKNGFWNRIKNNKKEEEQARQQPLAVSRHNNGKDPFLYFVRDALVATGFLELAGRRIDDEDDEEEDDEEEASDLDSKTEEDETKTAVGDDENDHEGDLQDDTVDFAGWDNRKKKIHKETRTQYFQIYKDMQFQYGIYLSSISGSEGGFATLSSVNADDATDSGSDAVLEQDTMKRWNDAMANACRKQLAEACIVDKRSTEAKGTDAWLTSKKPCPFDDAAAYAIQMYPSHLMRAGRVVEAARVLMSPKFVLARLVVLEPFEAANRHRENLEEMTKRSSLASEGRFDLGGDGNSIEPKDITLSAVKIMIKTIKERYPILVEKDTVHGHNVKGEKEEGEVGRTLHLIAAFLGEQAQNKLSMETYELCLNYKIAAMGPDHSSAGRTWRHMGHQYMNQYDYDDAINAYFESVRIERLQNNVDYSHVILALNSMAMIYGMTRRPKKAVDTYSQSLAVQKAQLGDTNLQVAETLNSMGIVYGMMCEFDSAIECYSESLYIKIRKLGKDHEHVADVYFNLGLVHNKHGDHEAAINDYQEALRIRKDILGEQHEDVARVLHHIGVVLSEMGEVGDAQRFYEECLRIRRLVLGDEHEDVARTLHNLGLVYYDGGNYDKALECLEDAVELGRKKVGKRSEKVADSLHSIGLVYQKLANFKDSISKYDEALKIRRAKLGRNHLDVAWTLHNMGDVYYMMGDLDKAMDTYEESYEIRLEKLGKGHVDVATTRNNMGVVYMKKGEHDAAMECFSTALAVREERLGPDHEKCSDTLHNMGLVHKNLKQYAEAILRYEQALRVRRMQLGENDMKVADTLYNMAIVYANTGEYAKAVERYKEALRTYRETGMSDDHPSVVNTLQWIKWGQKKLSKTVRRDV